MISLWLIGTTGIVSQKAPTPIFILLYGGIAISLGLCILGYRVIKTIGEDLTKITPSRYLVVVCIDICSQYVISCISNFWFFGAMMLWLDKTKVTWPAAVVEMLMV